MLSAGMSESTETGGPLGTPPGQPESPEIGGPLATPPGQMSPDGRYRWDGHAWQLVNQHLPAATPPSVIPAQYPQVQRVELRAGAAFKVGFFAFFGAGCASIIFWVILIIGLSLAGGLGALGLGALGSHH